MTDPIPPRSRIASDALACVLPSIATIDASLAQTQAMTEAVQAGDALEHCLGSRRPQHGQDLEDAEWRLRKLLAYVESLARLAESLPQAGPLGIAITLRARQIRCELGVIDAQWRQMDRDPEHQADLRADAAGEDLRDRISETAELIHEKDV